MKYIDSILYAHRRSTIKLLIIFSHLATVSTANNAFRLRLSLHSFFFHFHHSPLVFIESACGEALTRTRRTRSFDQAQCSLFRGRETKKEKNRKRIGRIFRTRIEIVDQVQHSNDGILCELCEQTDTGRYDTYSDTCRSVSDPSRCKSIKRIFHCATPMRRRLFSQTARLYETVKTSYRIRTPRAGFNRRRLYEDSRFSSSSVIPE